MIRQTAVLALAAAMAVLAGEVHNVRIDTSPDRVWTPLTGTFVSYRKNNTLSSKNVF